MEQIQVEQSRDLRADYERDGYVIIRNVLDPELVAATREHVDWLRAKHPNLRAEQLGHTLMTHDPFWVRLVSDDRLLDIAARFIGDDIALFASHYIAKPPFDGQPVLWHQDGSFWPLEPMEVTTLWLAADDSTPENGCMRVIPGSHRTDLQKMMARTDVDNVLSAAIDPALVDESEAVDIVLAAGDVSMHHPNLIHGSNPNHSPRWRRGLTIRYIPTTTRIISDERWPSAFVLRGEITPGVNDYNPWPRYVASEHMPFPGVEAWNARAEAWNAERLSAKRKA